MQAQAWAACVKQMIAGVGWVHTALGFFHGDIKPAAIYFRACDNRAFVTHFGLAQKIDGVGAGAGAVEGEHDTDDPCYASCYTGPYKAPELWLAEGSEHKPSYQTESWAVGATALELALGAPVFTTYNKIKSYAEGNWVAVKYRI